MSSRNSQPSVDVQIDNVGGTKGNTTKSSLGRKVANDAIEKSKDGMMGATVNIADQVSMTINFNF